eukprot:13398644-Ditylum_brightwellii.AAC.1
MDIAGILSDSRGWVPLMQSLCDARLCLGEPPSDAIVKVPAENLETKATPKVNSAWKMGNRRWKKRKSRGWV